MLHHSASEEQLLREPPWAQTTEVFQRLVDEMAKLEQRADARIEAEARGDGQGRYPTLDDDRSAYDRLQTQLRAMEAVGAGPPQASTATMTRSSSRGSLLPQVPATERFEDL